MGKPRFPGDLPGGDSGLNPGYEFRKGVFSNYPGMSPKYHTNNNNDSLEFMARMFIPFSDDPEGKKRTAFINSFEFSGRSMELAAALATTGRVNTGNAYGLGYIDFLLQKAQEQVREKYQVVDVLSDNYVSYFFGQSPPVFTYSGVLLNSRQDDWRTAFHIMYNDILRGTKLARKKLVVTLAYDDVFVTGVLVNMSQLLTAEFELGVDFNFSILVKRFDIHSRFGESVFPPTPVATYPYRLTPALFSNQQVDGVSSSIWNGESAVFTTGQRQKPGETTADTSGLTVEDAGNDPEVDYVAQTIHNSDVVRALRERGGAVGVGVADTLEDAF